MTDSSNSVPCRQCGNGFTLSSAELEFLAARGLNGTSGLCPTCRVERRAQFAPWNSGRGLARPTRQLYPAVCGACGAATQVPFIPREGRAVYCPACFEQQRAANPSQ